MDLKPYGLSDRWPRLGQLEQEIANLERARQEAEAEAHSARNALPQARERDAEALAQALRRNKKPPEPKHERSVQAQLQAAERNSLAYSKAVALAQSDLAEFVREHRGEIRAAILEALHEKAATLARYSLESLTLFNTIEDSRYLLRDLAPPPEPEPELPENWRGNKLTNSFLGFARAQPVGPSRGDIEGVLNHLSRLVEQFEQREAGAA